MRCVALFALAAVLAGCNVEADFSGTMDTEGLVAEEYQKEIATIDRLLFTEEPLGNDGVKALEKQLDALAARVKAARDTKFMKVESLELQLLAKKAGRLSPKRNGSALQNEWMRIRNNLFDDRAWFVRSAGDLEYAATALSTVTVQPEPQPEPKLVRSDPARQLELDEPRSTLTGKWQVRSIEISGKAATDPELMDSVWLFDEPRIVVTDRNGKASSFDYLTDGEYLQVTSTSEGSGFMAWKLQGGALRLAFYDGFAEKPSGFTATPGQTDPVFVSLRLVPVR